MTPRILPPYADVRASPHPQPDILAFAESTYDAAAARMGWPVDLIELEMPADRGR